MAARSKAPTKAPTSANTSAPSGRPRGRPHKMPPRVHAADAAPSDAPRLERFPVVQRRVALSRARIYRLVKCGAFPRPVRLGMNSVAWLSAEITAWIQARLAERDARADGADGHADDAD